MKNKYQDALEWIGNIDLNTSSDGYDSPKYVKDFYYGEYKSLQELVDKTVPNIHREIKLLHFLNDLIQNCRIYGGIKVGYIIVDNYKERRGLGSIISCPYTYKAIREKGVNSMEPLKIIEEFYERGWVDDE